MLERGATESPSKRRASSEELGWAGAKTGWPGAVRPAAGFNGAKKSFEGQIEKVSKEKRIEARK